jgi:hypothetical protein
MTIALLTLLFSRTHHSVLKIRGSGALSVLMSVLTEASTRSFFGAFGFCEEEEYVLPGRFAVPHGGGG